jgi:transcriptional regulator with GAF, ATPase, and Fis domain
MAGMARGSRSTLSVRRGPTARVASPARLIVAVEADRPTEPSTVHLLRDVDEVVIARGDRRHASRSTTAGVRQLLLTVPDRRLSTVHARIRRVLGHWVVEDAGSKNGVLIRGRACDRATLCSGDVVELGHTFLVFRDAVECAEELAEPLDGAVVASTPELGTASPPLAARFRAVARIASADVSILLSGESGTGKEVVARAVHRLSRRRGSFVAVNCGALPAALIEAELFGHRKGAYTGAIDDRIGLIRAAHGGTLLLDEIGDLPLSSQAALLRVLQEREVVPVGETRPVPVDLRLVAATHRDLPTLVDGGQFRADLLARLTGFGLALPPLRERIEDLGLLIAAILARLAHDPARVTFTPAAVRALFHHPWPFNVRELEKCLGVALGLAPAAEIDVGHLPLEVRSPRQPPPSLLSAHDERRRGELDERLRAARGNVSEVARAMGTSRVQVHRWVKKLGIDLKSYR